MKSSTKRVLVGLLEPVIRAFGTSRSLVQVPALMARRFVMLAIIAVGSLVFMFAGLALLLSGLMELSAVLGATWIVPTAVGTIIALGGLIGLTMSLRRDSWVQPLEQSLPPQGPHPLEMALLLAIEMIEERRSKRPPESMESVADQTPTTSTATPRHHTESNINLN